MPVERTTSTPERASSTLAALLARLDPESVDSALTPATAATPDNAVAEDPLAAMLQSVVDEGAPGESEVLERMQAIRGRMGFVNDDRTGERWSDPEGEVVDLLLHDLTHATDPGVRTLAAELIGPFLAPVVETLRREAVTGPESRTIKMHGGDVAVVGVDGTVDAGWRARLEQRLRQQTEVPALPRPAGYAALAVGAIAALLVAANSNWILLALAGFAAGITLLVRDHLARKEAATTVERNLRRADTEIERAVASQKELSATSQVSAAEAEGSAARLERRLAPDRSAPNRPK